MTGPLLSKKGTYKTFFTVRVRFAIIGRLAFLVSKIRLEHIRFGSK